MQAHSLFATFFAFLTLVAPWAAQAIQITTPTNLTTGDVSITCTTEASDPSGPLTFLIVRNSTTYTIAGNVSIPSQPEPMQIPVTIPKEISGDGWQINATLNNVVIGQSLPFTVAVVKSKGTPGMDAGAVVGVVLGGVVLVSLIVFFMFLHTRRIQKQHAARTFDLKDSFPPPKHSHNFSSSSNSDLESGTKFSADLDKMQWERELEEQFARARAGTPDVARGASPMPRTASPYIHGASPLPATPQRAFTRN